MRRIVLISWLVLISAALGSGVCAAMVHDRVVHGRAATSQNHNIYQDTGHRNLGSLAPEEVHPLTAGKVVAVDRANAKITVAHAPIPRFYLERMTRIFPVEDGAQLAGLTPGDKIRFDLKRDGDAKSYVITRIENSN